MKENISELIKSGERIVIAALTAGKLVPLGMLAALIVLIFRIPQIDLAPLLRELIDSWWFTFLGWFFLLILFLGGRWLFNVRERLHKAELERLTQVNQQSEQLLSKVLKPDQLKLDGGSGE